MTVHLGFLNIFNIEKMKTINIMNLYKTLKKRNDPLNKDSTWLDSVNISEERENISISVQANDRFGVIIELQYDDGTIKEL